MRLYFLLEGRRTEKKLYAAWLPKLLKEYRRLERPDDLTEKSYYLFSACGYPKILQSALSDAIKDVNKFKFDRLVLVLDCDEYTVADRQAEVENAISKSSEKLVTALPEIILQNRTVETWLLGNRKIITASPQSKEFREAFNFYDVSTLDPEAMSKHEAFENHAQWHHHYLKHAFKEKRLIYSKTDPGHACEETYLNQLVQRLDTGHVATFGKLVAMCKRYSAP